MSMHEGGVGPTNLRRVLLSIPFSMVQNSFKRGRLHFGPIFIFHRGRNGCLFDMLELQVTKPKATSPLKMAHKWHFSKSKWQLLMFLPFEQGFA